MIKENKYRYIFPVEKKGINLDTFVLSKRYDKINMTFEISRHWTKFYMIQN